MASERRLIDANTLEGEAICLYTYGGARYIPLTAIKRVPTVDAVEVVRCKDCVYWTTEGNGYCDDEPHCGNPYGIEGYPRETDFCSRGIRMSGTQPQREDV